MNRLVVLLAPLALLTACGPTPRQHTVGLLDQNLKTQLAPAIADGRAAVQPTPDGARVTLLAPTNFQDGPAALDNHYPDIRASVIEGLLDPRLMRVEVTDTSPLPEDQRQVRVQNVVRYFTANGVGEVIAPASPTQSAGPAGLQITIAVHCPKPDGLIGYGDGKAKPRCQ